MMPGESAPRRYHGCMNHGRLPWVTSAAMLLAILAAAIGVTPLTNNDIWLHLTTGRLILERGEVPHVDEYSLTRAGSPYTAHEWMAQVLFVLTHRWCGVTGLILLKPLALWVAGWELFRFVFIFADPVFRERIREWSGPFELPFAGSFHFYIYLLVLAAAVFTCGLLARRRRWAGATAIAGFCLLSTLSKRNASLLAIVSLPWIASTLGPAARAPSPSSSRRVSWAVAVGVLLVALLAGWRGLPHESGSRRRPGLGLGGNVPVEAVDWMARHGVERRALASFALASYVTYRCWPASTVLIDSRLDVYGGAQVERYFRAMTEEGEARRLLDTERPDYALLSYRLEQTGGMLRVLDEDPGWALVCFDDLAMLYLRQQPRWSGLIEDTGYRLLSPPTFLQGRARTRGSTGQLLEETARAEAAAPASRVARMMRATALQAAGRHEDALGRLEAAAGGNENPGDEALLLGLRASSLAALGRRQAALAAARRMLELLPESQFARSLIEELGGAPDP